MCKKTQFKYCPSVIDGCLVEVIAYLRRRGINTLACCCGHEKYPITIIVRHGIHLREIFSGKEILRKKKFYKRDKQGYYFIPEVLEK